MGDKLQSLAIKDSDMFILDHIDQELHSLKRSELKFGLSSESFLMCSFMCLGFLKHLLMP